MHQMGRKLLAPWGWRDREGPQLARACLCSSTQLRWEPGQGVVGGWEGARRKGAPGFSLLQPSLPAHIPRASGHTVTRKQQDLLRERIEGSRTAPPDSRGSSLDWRGHRTEQGSGR